MTRPSRSGTATPSRMTVRPCSTPMILRRPGEHGGDRAGAVGHDDLERRHAVAGGDHDAVDLAADPDRLSRDHLVEVGDPEAARSDPSAGRVRARRPRPATADPMTSRPHVQSTGVPGRGTVFLPSRPIADRVAAALVTDAGAASSQRRTSRSLASGLCEFFAAGDRGQQGQAVGHHRRDRVRPRHRPGVPQDRQGGPAARVPRRQGAAPRARGPHRHRPRPRAGTQRRHPAVPRQGRARARGRRHRHAGGRDHQWPRRGPGGVRRHTGGASRDHRARLRRAARRAAQPRRDRRRGRRPRSTPSSSGSARSATSIVRRQSATTSWSTWRRPATASPSPASTPRTGPTRSARAGCPTTSTSSSSGVVPGAELSFSTTPKGTDEPADVSIKVSRVQELVLPELTDEWVADNHRRVRHRRELDRQHPPPTRRDQAAPLTQRADRAHDRRARQAHRHRAAGRPRADRPAPPGRGHSSPARRPAASTSSSSWPPPARTPTPSSSGFRPESEQAVRLDLALRAVATAEAIDAD